MTVLERSQDLVFPQESKRREREDLGADSFIVERN